MDNLAQTSASLTDIFFTHADKAVDKWEQYLAVYTEELEIFRQRNRPVRLLEIGVQNGGSLEMWSKFLPAGSRILGIDIDPNIRNLHFAGPLVEARVADAGNLEQVNAAIGAETFDIIIDDGSHTSWDIIAAFNNLYDRLTPSGKFIIEDLHCSYYPSYGGGFFDTNSSINWLKLLADAVNFDHFADDPVVPAPVREALRNFNRTIKRVSFYDSMCVVEKLGADKTRPYRRMLSGQNPIVHVYENWIPHAPISTLESLVTTSRIGNEIDKVLLKLLEQHRQSEFAALQQSARLKAEVEALRSELNALKASGDRHS